MNVRKPTDYNALFTALDKLMEANLPQMELYCEIGRLVNRRLEKGAAVAAAEYLQGAYPDAAGFSPRNLRRMRNFYHTYESVPEVMAQAMTISWTQNVVILETKLTIHEKVWYIQAVQQFGWSKLELAKQIAASIHKEIILDLPEKVCYNEENNAMKCVGDNENSLYLLQPNGRVRDEGLGEKSRTRCAIPHRVCLHQHQGNRKPCLSPSPPEIGQAWNRLCWKNSTTTYQCRLRQVRPTNRDGPGQLAEYIPICGNGFVGKRYPLMEFIDHP